MSLLLDPCAKELNSALAEQGTHADLTAILNKSCARQGCPIHGQRGIAGLFIRLSDLLSPEELREGLTRTLKLYE